MKSLEERFWAKVDRSGECWNWTGCLARGYGRFRLQGGLTYAHRLSYELAFGSIAEGHDINHKCHNPSCVKPDHLEQVTRKQNMEDRSGAQRNSKTGVRGVSKRKDCNRYMADVNHNGKTHYLGLFDNIESAERAVIAKRNELFTHNQLDRPEVKP